MVLDDQTRNLSFPCLAPLSAPLIRHLHVQGVLTPALLAELPALRLQIYQDLQRFVRWGQLSERAFLAIRHAGATLGAVPTRQHLNGWLARGLLRTVSPDTLDPQTAAGLLLALQLIARARLDGLPAVLNPTESSWWCWRQDSPDSAPRPCALPLPGDLPSTALVWTPWPGATWLPDWHAFDRGAVYVPATLSNTAIMSAFQVWQVPDLAIAWLDRHSLAETTRGRALVREQWVQRATRLVRARLAIPRS